MTNSGMTTLTVDPDVVRLHRAILLAEADELAGLAAGLAALGPPGTGLLAPPTVAAIDTVVGRATRLAGRLRELADAVDRWVGCAGATDDQVALGLGSPRLLAPGAGR